MTADVQFMNHEYIEEHGIADRYTLGRLSADEKSRFEEHFLDCRECLDRLEAIEGLRDGLKIMAADEFSRSRAFVPRGLAGWLLRFSGWQQTAGLASLAVLLAALPLTFILHDVGRARRDLEGAKRTAADWERRYAEQDAALARERNARAALADELGRLSPAQVQAPVFNLEVSRSVELSPTAPSNRIRLTSSPQWIVLSLEREAEPEFRSYRAALSTSSGQLLWQGDKLKPASREVMALSFYSRIFKTGDYLLSLEGLTAKGRYVLVARYPFRIALEK